MQYQNDFFNRIHWTSYARSMRRIHQTRDYNRRRIMIVKQVHAKPIAKMIPLEVTHIETPVPKPDTAESPTFECMTSLWSKELNY